MTFRAERGDDAARLYVAGELDFSTADSLVERAGSLIGPPAPHALTLDLGGVTFCASAGVGALVQIHRLAGEVAVAVGLANTPEQIRYVLALTGVDELFADHTV